ncbi:MAG: molecular chaperone HtpG, partial [Parachlamydiales bacterium]|nr:molecular chaperone HtpG [Parachlamydiales bacterium]
MEKDLTINSKNILPIIKKWLYSEKDIFLRELVSNSLDAILKLKYLNPKKDDFRIDISLDKDKKTIRVKDNGIGMSFEEVEKYISEIAFSGAEDFVKKHEIKEEFIGHFGLGFYSSFMVAKKVDIKTQSYKEDEDSVFWVSDGSSKYTIDRIDKVASGTEITLHLDDEDEQFLDINHIKKILLKYCRFFEYPIYLNSENINNEKPLWLNSSKDLKDEDYLNFFNLLYPMEPEPIFWIHLDVDVPFLLKGILYFPKIETNFDINKNSVQLYSNRVFVAESAKDILPEYLSILKGAIDSPDIPLNVSRSYLQVDKTIKQLGSHISKKITDKLKKIYLEDKDKFTSIYKSIEPFIKLGILNDEKFYERSKEFLLFETFDNKWITVEEYLEQHKNNTDSKIFYAIKDKFSSSLLNLFKEKQIDVIFTNSYLDPSIISFLENKHNYKFMRIDGSIDPTILDKSKENTLIDSDGKSINSKLCDFVKSSIEKDVDIEAQSLNNEKLSSFILIQEDQRRLNDYMSIYGQKSLPIKHTLVLNTNNKLVKKIFEIQSKNPLLAKKLSNIIYDMALLSQKELKMNDLSSYISRSNEV